MKLIVTVKDTDNIIGLKEDIVSRIEDIADVERVDVEDDAHIAHVPRATLAEGEYFTPQQVRKMSPQEIHKNYSKIMESMKRWS